MIDYQKTEQPVRAESHIPGGILVCLVWEDIRRQQLGNRTGKALVFWEFAREERNRIREEFERSFKYFWIGFDDGWHEAKPRVWSSYRMAQFDLIRRTQPVAVTSPDWDGDVSEGLFEW
ncbi:uncharacterized protein N7477_007337 [Penicillium maclennaniae]|uniref:uncharacterized protein n=1 Tax=Penicillium maclennaniae TaxID=1343394 RepID=UPI002540D8B0|nr:uncharacterized protein N7477_007337 [Penicillium maclennaniae]KAJ5664889.1 hypothetical protein N7477_007337 [Penicillium maclennaniae]